MSTNLRITPAVLLTIIAMTGALVGASKNHAHPDNSKPTPVEKYNTMPSGVDFFDIVEGSGREAVMGSTVTVNYTGWLTTGKKFDSSYDRGEPFTFRVGGRVIRGWNEGLQGMKVGGKRQLRIPADLAYGHNGQPPMIPPNATLIFDVELLNVK